MSMSDIVKIFKEKWNKDYTTKALLVSIPVLVAAIFFHSGLFSLIFFILSFTVFDIFGFKNVQIINSLKQTTDLDATLNYRIIQQIFYFCSLLFVWYISGSFITVLGCLVAHWFTTCDWLFYIFQKDSYYYDSDTNVYPWLEGWSIFLVLKHLGLTATKQNFTTMALLGIFLSAFMILLFS